MQRASFTTNARPAPGHIPLPDVKFRPKFTKSTAPVSHSLKSIFAALRSSNVFQGSLLPTQVKCSGWQWIL